MHPSVIVVKDEADETILLLSPGAQCAYPEGYWLRKQGDFSRGTRWQEAKRNPWKLREFTWQTNRILIFLEPQQYYACFLFWDHDSDQFKGYYINFQLPYQRSHCGFDTLDLDLDIVIDPEFNWNWKDENLYEAGIREGGIDARWVKAIKRSLPEVFDRLSKRGQPLNKSWLDWRPDIAWQPPSLPARWQEI